MGYHDLFSCWADVQREFDMDEPEPEFVVFAGYEYENYGGEAHVIYRDQGKLWLVSGSHCSCYGLEGQWEPEETTREVIVRMVEKSKERGWDEDVLCRHATEIMLRLRVDGIGR